MKKLILITALLGTVVVGCKKESVSAKFCWACTMKTVSQMSGDMPSIDQEIETDFCDRTEAEIREVEASGNSTITQSIDGITMTTKVTTTCTKK